MAIADILKTLVPQLLRGGMAGLNAPRTGSAMDLLSGFGAAEEDRDKRDMLAFQRRRMLEQRMLEQENLQRQIAKDRESSELNRARIELMGAQTKRQNSPAAVRPDPAEQRTREYQSRYKNFVETMKREPTEEEKLILQGVQQQKPFFRPAQQPTSIAAHEVRILAGMDPSDPGYPAQEEKVRKAYATQQGMEFGKQRDGGAYTNPRLFQTPTGPMWGVPPRLEPGQSAAVKDAAGKQVGPKPSTPLRVSPQMQSNMDAQALANEFLSAAGGDASTAETALKASNDARVKRHMAQAIQILRRLQPKKGGSDLDKQLDDLLAKPKAPANDGWNKTKGGARFRPVP